MSKERLSGAKEISESKFLLILHSTAKGANGNQEMINTINELLTDLQRYKQMDVRVRFFDSEFGLWMQPENKGPVGFGKDRI